MFHLGTLTGASIETCSCPAKSISKPFSARDARFSSAGQQRVWLAGRESYQFPRLFARKNFELNNYENAWTANDAEQGTLGANRWAHICMGEVITLVKQRFVQ